MERHGASEVGEQFVRDSHLTMQRDSWSEEIDPLRNTNDNGRWSESADSFQRDSPYILEVESHPLDRDPMDRDSLSEEDDPLTKPAERDSRSVLAHGDALNRQLAGRPPPVRGGHESDRVASRDSAFRNEGDCLSVERAYPPKGGYDRAHETAKGYDRLSVERAHTMKDFEKQITELKKENFNLKLRIYFLEEQVQRHCDNSSEELQRMNIELKVEVESLKHEYQEKHNLLIRASKAMESLSGERSCSIQQLKDEHLQQLQDLDEAARRKTRLLEAELRQEKAELEKMCVLLDQERMQRFNTEERLLAVKDQYSKSVGILEERDWIIQCLNETLRSKDALIAQLEKQINAMMPTDASDAAKALGLPPENDLREERSRSPGLACRDCLATKNSEEKEDVNEWQKEVREMGNVISELQRKLEESKAGVALEEKNSAKRDKAIQGLTAALKKKSKENEKLLKEIENLNAALAEAKQWQGLRNGGDPDYKKLILTIQTQQDLCSRLHEYERESGSLQKELDAIAMLRRWLEKDIRSNQELRRVLEAQIAAKSRESDTMSFLGDQTSYLSICLDHLSDNHIDRSMEAVVRPPAKSVETQTPLAEEHSNSLQDGQPPALEKDAEEERAAAAAVHPKRQSTERSQSTASSSTQTELKCYADKGVLADVSAFGEDAKEGIKNGAEAIISGSESHPSASDVAKDSRQIQNGKRQKCFTNNQTKSKIPVLSTSSLSRLLKTEACPTSRVNEHEAELREENGRLLEQLRCAKLEIEDLRSNLKTKTLDHEKPKSTGQVWDDNAESASPRQIIQGDLESAGLGGLSQRVKLEIEAIKPNKEQPSGSQGWGDTDNARSESPRQILLEDLESARLSEQGKGAEIAMGKLQLVEDAGKCNEYPSNVEKPEREERASLQHQESQVGNDNLSLKLKPKRLETKEPPSREATSEKANTQSVLDHMAERDSASPSLQKELELENLRLAEQLKRAQMNIEKLQTRTANLENENARSGLDSAYAFERDAAVSSLIKELQLENQRLVEQLKCAQEEIEKLREEKALQDIDNSFRLDHLDAEDRDSERSFLDKTITDAVGLSEIHNVNPDFEVRVNARDFTCQNIAGLCCHHNRFCLECANNQETLIVQAASFKKVSTIQKECKLLTVSHSHRPFEDASLSKYDLLVQSQARELSHQRQKIKESHNLSVVCSKNFINVLKAFEDLLSNGSLDSNVALGFQEQLDQTVEWLKEMEYKLSDAYYGEDDANSDHSADSLLYTPSRLVPGHKMWADKHGCHVLGLVEDYNALRKQILEAKTVLEETEDFIDHGAQTAVLNMTEHFGNVFFEKLNRTKQSLEEANCLLKLLWRVSLPLQTHSSYSIRQVEETNLEMTRLRKRVLEQEKLLSGMVKRVYSENQMKEDIEKRILNQLAMTHEILKRAKGNLEVQVVDKH